MSSAASELARSYGLVALRCAEWTKTACSVCKEAKGPCCLGRCRRQQGPFVASEGSEVTHGAAGLVVVLVMGVSKDLEQRTVRLHALGRPVEGRLMLGLDLVPALDQFVQ